MFCIAIFLSLYLPFSFSILEVSLLPKMAALPHCRLSLFFFLSSSLFFYILSFLSYFFTLPFQSFSMMTKSKMAASPIIAVGAGSGGSVMASRLSEVEGWRVLVVEAGGPPSAETFLPAFVPFFFLPGHDLDWDYTSTPQKHGLKNFENRVRIGCRHFSFLFQCYARTHATKHTYPHMYVYTYTYI